jgi:hypothetical protein
VGGLTFLNPSLWPWLLALGIPILIHLLTRRARRRVTLPTFQFLQKAMAQQSQIFRMRRWLLLVLRCLFLLLLVLTFLKPTLTAPLARDGTGKRVAILILDTSLSMNAERGGVTGIARARSQGMTLLDDLRSGDAANVILARSMPRPILPKPGSDLGTLRQVVKGATATSERGDMAAAVALAAEQLAASEAAHKELWLASDFQRTNWADARFDTLPPDVKLIFLNADSEERSNAAVTGLKLRPTTPRAGEEAEVQAEVWNGAPVSRTLSITLSIEQEGSPPSDTRYPTPDTLTVPPYATGTVSFPVTFSQAGRYRLVARVPADGLPQDDARYLAADLRHSQTVLLLTDAEMNGSSGSYFLMRALNPTPDHPGGVRVIPKRAAALTETDLKTCDAVVLNEVTTFPADRIPLLYRYVADGGALMIFLSGPNVVGQVNALKKLATGGEGLPFLPQSLMDVRSQAKGYVSLTEARYDSPLLKVFKDPEAADLGNIRFTRFYLTTEPDQRTEVLLKFEDSTPAAARRNLGAGSVLLCNFSVSPGDSDMARQEVFPPLLHEFLKGMTKKEGDRRDFVPGGIASATLDAGVSRSGVRAVGPKGQNEPVTVDKAGGGVIIERVESPGFHSILANGQAVATIAVNTHTDESDLRAIDPRELESKRSARGTYMVNAGGSGSSAALEDLRRPRPLWPYFLIAAFVALLLEHTVATFGGQARVHPQKGNGISSPN